MSQEKYMGMDVHAATISAAVMNQSGKLLMECVLETRAATILEFIQGLFARKATVRCAVFSTQPWLSTGVIS
jgi:hypothetical protein